MTRITRSAIAVFGATAALALSGCSQVEDIVGSDEPDRDPSGQVTETEAGADVFALKVGDCTMGFTAETEVSELDIVPCDQPHVDEYYASVSVPDGDYPGDEAINAQAETDCTAEFETFVGVAYADSELYVSFLTPTQESWETQNDREILCSVYEEGVETTGSLAGAAR